MALLLPNAQSLTEDTTRFEGIVNGCVEASALIAAHIINGAPLNTKQLYALISGANAVGMADRNGQTNAGLAWDLKQFGIGVNIYPRTNNPSVVEQQIESALQAGKPVLIGTMYGSALSNEQPKLGGHEVTIVGEVAPGGPYITADPNSPQSFSGGFTYNTIQQLMNAGAQVAVPTLAGPGGLQTTTLSDTTNTTNTQSSNNPPPWWTWLFPPTEAMNLWNQASQSVGYSGLGTQISQGIMGAISAPFQGLGIANLRDLLWRLLLIGGGIFLVVAGLIAVMHEQIGQAGKTAAMAA